MSRIGVPRSYPKQAVLRRHPPPKEAMMEKVVQELGALGVVLDTQSAGSLANSIRSIAQGEQGQVQSKDTQIV